MRKPHYVHRNESTRVPTRVVYLDTEAYVKEKNGIQEHTLRLGYAEYVRYGRNVEPNREESLKFKTKKGFWAWLEELSHPKTTTWVVAHNMHYDFSILAGIEYVLKGLWNIELFAVESSHFILKVKRGERKLVFVDLGNYYGHIPLERIAHMLGMEKVPIEDFNEAPDSVLWERVIQDVKILRRAFEELLRWWYGEKLGIFAYSASGLAWNAYRHKFMHKIPKIHGIPEVDQLELEALHGGLLYAFRVGKFEGDFYYVDHKAFYPYIMGFRKFPYRLLEYNMHPDPDDLTPIEEHLRRHAVIAKVLVETDRQYYPKRYNDHVIYPVGRFVTTLTTPELKLALLRGDLKRVYAYSAYSQDYLFTDFVRYFWNLRKKYAKESPIKERFIKVLMNSLFGKWAQKKREIRTVEVDPTPPGVTHYYVNDTEKIDTTVFSIGDKQYITVTNGLAWNAFPAIASHITAYGRVRMWDIIHSIGTEHVYYVDTDGLIVDRDGLEKIKEYFGLKPGVLGGLEIRLRIRKLEIFGPKAYVYDNTPVLAGVPKAHAKIGEEEIRVPRWYRLKGLLRRGITDRVVVKFTTWKKKSEIYWGQIGPHGRILPLHIEEDPHGP